MGFEPITSFWNRYANRNLCYFAQFREVASLPVNKCGFQAMLKDPNVRGPLDTYHIT